MVGKTWLCLRSERDHDRTIGSLGYPDLCQNPSQVLENTLSSAVEPPRQRGFVTSRFVYGRDAAVRKAAGLTELRFSTSRPPSALENATGGHSVSFRRMTVHPANRVQLRLVSAQPATTTKASAYPDTTPYMGEREMRVVIRPNKLNFWEYQGTRAQLEAEGVIPAKTEWPEGSRTLCWVDGRFRWSLRRKRPEGLKGPMKLWTTGDWWVLRCDLLSNLLNGPDHATQLILEKGRELAEELYRQSTAGQRELYASLARYRATVDDKAFQAFKGLIPGLVPSRRGHKPVGGT